MYPILIPVTHSCDAAILSQMSSWQQKHFSKLHCIQCGQSSAIKPKEVSLGIIHTSGVKKKHGQNADEVGQIILVSCVEQDT